MKRYKMAFGGDTLLVELEGNVVTELCMTTDHNDLMVFCEAERVEIDERKLYEGMGGEWQYGDCWKYVKDNGMDAFLAEFEVKP